MNYLDSFRDDMGSWKRGGLRCRRDAWESGVGCMEVEICECLERGIRD